MPKHRYTFDLPVDLYARLKAEAITERVPLSKFLVHLLTEYVENQTVDPAKDAWRTQLLDYLAAMADDLNALRMQRP